MSKTPPEARMLDPLRQNGPSGDATDAEPPGRPVEEAADREVYLAHELPTEWVAQLEKPVPPYETELDGVADRPEADEHLRAEARERARQAAQAMDELSRGLTLGGLLLRELIGRDRL